MPVGGRQRRGIGTGDSQGQSEKEKAARHSILPCHHRQHVHRMW